MTLAVNLPNHLYGYVRRSFLSNDECMGWEPAVWFGLTCPKNRAFGLSVLLECGGLYRELPPHAWAFSEKAPECGIEAAQAYDCFGGDVQAVEYDYLRELRTTLIRTGERGSYLFTVEFFNNGFSNYPPQSKAMHALALDSGLLTFQPGNHFTVFESSFTDLNADCSWLRRQSEPWGVEDYPAEEVTK